MLQYIILFKQYQYSCQTVYWNLKQITYRHIMETTHANIKIQVGCLGLTMLEGSQGRHWSSDWEFLRSWTQKNQDIFKLSQTKNLQKKSSWPQNIKPYWTRKCGSLHHSTNHQYLKKNFNNTSCCSRVKIPWQMNQ